MAHRVGCFDHRTKIELQKHLTDAAQAAEYAPAEFLYLQNNKNDEALLIEKLSQYDVAICHGLSRPEGPEELISALQPGSVCLFISTSGYSGLPKGCSPPKKRANGVYVFGLVTHYDDESIPWAEFLRLFSDSRRLDVLLDAARSGGAAELAEYFWIQSSELIEVMAILCQGFLAARLQIGPEGELIEEDEATHNALRRMKMYEFMRSDQGKRWWSEFCRKDSKAKRSLRDRALEDSAKAKWWDVLCEDVGAESGIEELRKQWGTEPRDVFEASVAPLIDEIRSGASISRKRVVDAYNAIHERLANVPEAFAND